MYIDIRCGDSYSLIKSLSDASVDLILTDVPYNVSKENNIKTMPDRNGRNGIDFGEWDDGFDLNTLKEFVPLLKQDGSFITFCAFEQYVEIRRILESAGLICKDKFIWKKTNPMPRNRNRSYISNCEMGVWFVRKGGKWTFNRQNEKYQQMVFEYPSESGGGMKRYHPTQKNVKLLEELIKIHSNENDVIFDPFMGSGSTCIAAFNTGRHFIGFEKERKYYDIACNRLNEVKNG